MIASGAPRGQRRLIVQTVQDLVDIDVPRTDVARTIPVVTCNQSPFDLPAWCIEQRSQLSELRQRHGGVLLRGFEVGGVAGLQKVLAALGDEPMPYVERSSPRTRVGENVYTSTEYTASQTIPPHNENSYAHQWPLHIAFHCRVPASTGGETPIVDCRRVLASLDAAIVDRFRERGLLYVRNYHPGLGLAWNEVFGVETPAEVEDCCRRAGYRFEWSSSGVLRTWRRTPAIVLHPRTQERTWFNHGAFFHVSTLPQEISRGLLHRFAPEELPNHCFYGDGGAIEAETVAHISEAYRANTFTFAWRAEDLLLLDNMLMAHGRRPFSGQRSVLVSICDKVGASTVLSG